jgi:hypothetical protein
MVFSTCPKEPVFDFLASPPPACLVPAQINDLRVVFWRFLSRIPWSTRNPGAPGTMHEAAADTAQELDRLEQGLAAQLATTLLMPARGESPAGQSIPVSIDLRGAALQVEGLGGRLVVDGAGVTVTKLELAAPVAAAGFALLAEAAGGPAVRFKIERPAGPAPLPAGPVLTATIAIDTVAKGLYPLSVDDVKTEPKRAICPVGNAVIVTPP